MERGARARLTGLGLQRGRGAVVLLNCKIRVGRVAAAPPLMRGGRAEGGGFWFWHSAATMHLVPILCGILARTVLPCYLQPSCLLTAVACFSLLLCNSRVSLPWYGSLTRLHIQPFTCVSCALLPTVVVGSTIRKRSGARHGLGAPTQQAVEPNLAYMRRDSDLRWRPYQSNAQKNPGVP